MNGHYAAITPAGAALTMLAGSVRFRDTLIYGGSCVAVKFGFAFAAAGATFWEGTPAVLAQVSGLVVAFAGLATAVTAAMSKFLQVRETVVNNTRHIDELKAQNGRQQSTIDAQAVTILELRARTHDLASGLQRSDDKAAFAALDHADACRPSTSTTCAAAAGAASLVLHDAAKAAAIVLDAAAAAAAALPAKPPQER